MARLHFNGRARVRHIRNGLVLSDQTNHNKVVDEGINKFLTNYFSTGATISAYCYLTNGTAFVAGTTAASYTGLATYNGTVDSDIPWDPPFPSTPPYPSAIELVGAEGTVNCVDGGSTYTVAEQTIGGIVTFGGARTLLIGGIVLPNPIAMVDGDSVTIQYTLAVTRS